MKILKILLIYCILILSCTNPEKEKKRMDEIKDLIESHKTELIFLSFWPNMSDNEFQKIIEYENKCGNLTNGNFVLNVKKDRVDFKNRSLKTQPYDTVKKTVYFVPYNFKVKRNYDGMIELHYHDEEWVECHPKFLPSIDGTYKLIEYSDITDYLIEYFNSKYLIIDDEKSKIWKKSNDNQTIVHLITLSSAYTNKIESINGCPITRTSIERKHEKGKDFVKIANSDIRIWYETSEHFEKGKKDAEINRIKDINKRKQEILELEENNHNL